MTFALITGSNRGLGLAWVRQCAARGSREMGTCRNPGAAADLQELVSRHPARIRIRRLDVTVPDQIRDLAEQLREETVDLLVNNAGVYFERSGKDPIGSIDYEAWLETFRVNTLGPVRVTEAFLPHRTRSERPVVATITSHMGSIADITAPKDYAYRSSKAAFNATVHGLVHELNPRGVGVLLLHPG